MGTKPPEVPYLIPLCRLCHTALHQDPNRFEEREQFCQKQAALRTVERAFFEGVLNIDL